MYRKTVHSLPATSAGQHRRRYLTLPCVALGMLLAPLVGSESHAQATKDLPRPSAQAPAASTLPVKIEQTFKYLEIDRPVVITNAGDGSDRLFIASQMGTIYVMPNDPEVEEPAVFMDMNELVTYKEKENEEGFLGLAFHPKFSENGQFFVFYSTSQTPHTSVISRFRTMEGDPSQGDLNSEEVLMTIPQKFWNHNGGTIAFGPDGYLYIGLGDGGSANDPDGNGQNLATLNGSMLRIDVDHKGDGLPYAIPKDNPFVDREGARPEIYAYGLRNVWRLSFDRKTGTLWAADVGQNTWEEIDIIKSGGNYGWNLREGKHPFGENGVEARDDLIEPIWEYPHEENKGSITGGVVYRGKKIPELDGVYLFGDYVFGKIWGLNYDIEANDVIGHYDFTGDYEPPVITFGEDEAGEVYFSEPAGKIFTFVRDSSAKSNPGKLPAKVNDDQP